MQTKLIINGVNFAPWIQEDGMEQSVIYRNLQSIVTMDGVEHRDGVEKRKISVRLVAMRDSNHAMLCNALTSPATVEYTDAKGYDRTALFYVSDPTATARMIRNGVTYWNGISFTLEER